MLNGKDLRAVIKVQNDLRQELIELEKQNEVLQVNIANAKDELKN